MTTDLNPLKTKTAFKHPQCGGLILMVEEKNRVFFQCDTCLEVAEHLEQLAIGKPVIVRTSRRTIPKKLVVPEPEG